MALFCGFASVSFHAKSMLRVEEYCDFEEYVDFLFENYHYFRKKILIIILNR